MELDMTSGANLLWGSLGKVMRACAYRVLSVGPIPNHLAFIMDGNRRYAKKHNLNVWEGHERGSLALISVLRYLYELGVKYITVYAFSIDNFRRKPDQVRVLMELLMQKTGELLKQESVVNVYGIRVQFVGKLNLLAKPVKEAAEKVMAATANNTKATLFICVAYTSTEEIVHAVHETCKHELKDNPNEVNRYDRGKEQSGKPNSIEVADLEKNFYLGIAPEPDILIRSSGATRLSNFLLWQSPYCPLYNPAALWPEIGFYQIFQAVLIYQRNHSYLKKEKKAANSLYNQ